VRSEGFYVNEKSLTLAGIEPAFFRFVAQHLNHCATAVPPVKSYNIKIVAEIENCAILDSYASSSGNFFPRFLGQIPKGILKPEEGTNRLSRNVGNKLPIHAA